MTQESLPVIFTILGLLSVFAFFYRRRHTLSHIRGPKRPSFLLGVEHLWSRQQATGDVDSKWFDTYGDVVKIPTFYGADQLLVADPKACQHILQTSQYNFPKTGDVVSRFRVMLGGMGMISCTGDVHQRQRRVMLPAFTKGQLRSFLEVFRHTGERLARTWKNSIRPQGTVLNVAPWLARATLDVIGQSAFEYKFNSLDPDGEKGELGVALKDMIIESQLYPRKTALLYHGMLRAVPDAFIPLLELLPSKQNGRFRKFFRLAVNVVQQTIDERLKEVDPENTVDKDVLGVLLRANRAEDPKKRLNDEELIAQLMTIVVAGHETTAGTVSWLLYELSKHPKDQERLRNEVRERKETLALGQEFSDLDYDSMPVLNATLKEALRVHPIILSLTRHAKCDDVLPLSEPLMTDKGPVTEIPISKGQVVNVSVWQYNRLKSVWGDDAEEWSIDRWLDERDTKKQTKVGMMSNVLTFSGGLQGCIGWRFAVMEAQALVAHLVETFEFAPDPNTKGEILHVPVGRTSAPMIRGDVEGGLQLPLLVKVIGEAN